MEKRKIGFSYLISSYLVNIRNYEILEMPKFRSFNQGVEKFCLSYQRCCQNASFLFLCFDLFKTKKKNI